MPATRSASKSVSSVKTASRELARAFAATPEPMYATIGTGIPEGDGWAFEPKYDGIRVVAVCTARGTRLVTRNGKDKASQFPEIADALTALARERKQRLVLDGEVVALDGDEPARFQELQSRMHVKDASSITRFATETPAALLVFDLLVVGDEALLLEPWTARRARLEALLAKRRDDRVRLGDSARDGEKLLAQAHRAGWEGMIAKRTSATYVPGARSRDWLKLKIEHRQEFVVGGWTEPRNSREHLGAMLLGYFDDDGKLVYVGHTGGGFTRDSLRDMRRRLDALARKTSPFAVPPRTNEVAHWVSPRIVVEVKFSEWTADGRLRQPIFLGIRDDKDAREVGREAESVQDRA